MKLMARPSHSIFIASVIVAGIVTTITMSSKSSPPQPQPHPKDGFVTWDIPPGARIEEIATIWAAATSGDPEILQSKAYDAELIGSLGIDATSLEGYLKPGVHRTPRGATANDVIAELVKSQQRTLDERKDLITASGLTPHEVLTLASMLEKESSELRPALAAAWRQRLRINLRLESHGALAFVQQGKIDRSFDSPFNTFIHHGLPPHPIGNPTAETIDAVLHAVESAETVVLRGRQPSPEEIEALRAVPVDPPPASLARDTHYWVSNEMRHDVVRSSIEHKGGIYMGVGTDQCYLLAGWMRPDMMVLMDFDQAVIHLHNIYRLIFLAAETPERFSELWSFAGRKDLYGLIKAANPTPAKRRQLHLILEEARPKVAWRFKRMRDIYQPLGVPTFLDSPEQYAHLRALFTGDRVFAIRGDLTGKKAMRNLGKVFGENGRTVGLVYLSNAEQYFGYTENFRTNIRSLPLDANSTLFRTRPAGKDYVYILQPLENFRRWLEEPHIRGVAYVAPKKSLNVKKRPLVMIDGDPPPPPTSKRKSSEGKKAPAAKTATRP